MKILLAPLWWQRIIIKDLKKNLSETIFISFHQVGRAVRLALTPFLLSPPPHLLSGSFLLFLGPAQTHG